jgi:hypothetical protein
MADPSLHLASHVAAYRSTGVRPAMDITTLQMVLVMKLISFAWSVYDSQRPDSELDATQRASKIEGVPGLLPFLGYAHVFSFLLFLSDELTPFSPIASSSHRSSPALRSPSDPTSPSPPTRSSRRRTRPQRPLLPIRLLFQLVVVARRRSAWSPVLCSSASIQCTEGNSG